jgi:transcriptional regulator with XRE-family HTH domain
MRASLPIQIGSCIRGWRRAAGFTIARLGEMASVDTGFLAYIENGKKLPSVTTLAKIAGALGISLSELLKGVPADSQPLKLNITKQVEGLLRDGVAKAHKEDIVVVLRHLADARKAKAMRHLVGR